MTPQIAAAVFSAILAMIVPRAHAASITETVPVAVHRGLSFGIGNITADCSWPPGQLVFTPAVTGGDGNPITWNLVLPTGNTDFAINTSTGAVSVGANGIAPADCNTTVNLQLPLSPAVHRSLRCPPAPNLIGAPQRQQLTGVPHRIHLAVWFWPLCCHWDTPPRARPVAPAPGLRRSSTIEEGRSPR